VLAHVLADQQVREEVEHPWQSLRDESQAPINLERLVERVIVALLRTGDCSLERVAHLVEQKPRTLQAQLQGEQLRFGTLPQRVRERLAREHLASSDIDLTSLAMNLGYGDLTVFSRAFKRWSGLSPRA
jgi:AraC-like DNA-binding protein